MMTRSYATINGFELAYSVHGDARRPAVVLSHALATSMELWGYQLPLLASHFRVVLYDLRGHGKSEGPGDEYKLEALASDVAALLDHLEIQRASFVGLSIGGMIGQHLAVQFPDMITGLVLCSTGGRTEPEAKLTLGERINKVRSEGLKSQLEATLARWFTPHFIQEAPETIAWVSQQILGTSISGFVGCAHAVQGLDIIDALGQVRAKTLLIPGEFDATFPEKVSRTLQQKIPNADLVVLNGAAHIGNVEQAHRFNEILMHFLRGISA
jgi:3-oxoadipate enol-lactonase